MIAPLDGNAETAVKICGVTNASDAEGVIAAGADAIGINFWPSSKRFVAPAAAAKWAPAFAGKILRIGVFVNAPLDDVERAVSDGLVDMVQFHGDETPDYEESAARRRLDFISVIGVKSHDILLGLNDFRSRYLLLDAFAPGLYGGTGETIDWEVARHFASAHPDRRIILSGGLHPGNVGEAVAVVRPVMVDVASGVELSPGIKDLGKVREFVASAKRPAH